jgi:hypothetical protein
MQPRANIAPGLALLLLLLNGLRCGLDQHTKTIGGELLTRTATANLIKKRWPLLRGWAQQNCLQVHIPKLLADLMVASHLLR